MAAPAGRAEPGPGGRRPAASRPAASAPQRPLTAAEQRAAEVRARRPPRTPRDPEAERAKIEGRTREEWVDEGALRAEASDAASERLPRPRRPTPRRAKGVDPETSATIASAARDAAGRPCSPSGSAQAQQALDGERFDDARRIASRCCASSPTSPPCTRCSAWPPTAPGGGSRRPPSSSSPRPLHPSVELLPVLADVYRAQRRFADVERIWAEVREHSPAPEVLAEARIVAAGAHADQGDLSGALRTMGRATDVPKRVRDHHLRQWYVLGDLHDRAGDPLEATRWFELVADHDPDFVDVVDRLRALGR